ncbi:ABC transporter substrate-binding protein [Natronohydrobacter thiooxidans]|uniref:ABC transporter substrate-binding protein n=1 Tax=Natronohydrobacter thiooxidans TaxID=87172 RepID=UPI0008FF125E|nr:ABC transporter substrate-binding protein [Natronohydrobacter thiooxidans]
MKSGLYAGVATLALMAAGANAQNLIIEQGTEGFNWDSFDAFAEANDFSGQTLTITGPWTGADGQMVNNMLAYFAAATGADVRYSGSDSFEQDIVIAVQANSAPNLAVFPQPGLAADLAGRGALAPLGQEAADWMVENYAAGQSWVDLGSFAGPDGEDDFFGFFYKVDVKSLVWYSPDQFDEAGYDIPETLEDLKALSQQIVDDGGTPWCIGLGSGAATGWPATDWVEDMMLRLHEPEIYDQWVTNELPFNSAEVVEAIELYGTFVRSDGWAQGGAEASATTDFRDSPAGLFQIPPACYMHKQASFIPTFFPDGSVYGEDYDFFYFPASAERDLGNPVLGAGTLFGITNDSPAARGLIEFFKTPIAHEVWMAQSGFLTPHTGVNLDVFSTDALRAMNQILLDATTFRFDASDLMPGEIGAGAFWTGMVDYTTQGNAQAAADAIQARWDAMR